MRENANESFTRYGKILVKITAEQVKQNQVLFTKFKDITYEKVGASEFPEGNNVAVYNEFSRILCNTTQGLLNFWTHLDKRLLLAKGKLPCWDRI